MKDDLISRSEAIAALIKQPQLTPSVIRRVLHQVPTVNAAELPCKVGDTVWFIRVYGRGSKVAKPGVVTEIYFTENMRIGVMAKHHGIGEWGSTVFATEAEALRALEDENAKFG